MFITQHLPASVLLADATSPSPCTCRLQRHVSSFRRTLWQIVQPRARSILSGLKVSEHLSLP